MPFEHFGFHSSPECCQQLLLTQDFISNCTGNGSFADVIYFDFRKAFDMVPHQRLISKLQSVGFVDAALNLLTNFILNRSQQVRISDSFSDLITALSGVPQGSVLGPLPFLTFVADLPSLASPVSKMYQSLTILTFRRIYFPASYNRLTSLICRENKCFGVVTHEEFKYNIIIPRPNSAGETSICEHASKW